jgi:hypothetical protein
MFQYFLQMDRMFAKETDISLYNDNHLLVRLAKLRPKVSLRQSDSKDNLLNLIMVKNIV